MPKINITGNASAGNKAADMEKAYAARDAAQRAQSTKAQQIADAIDKRGRTDPSKKRAQEDAMWRDRERRMKDFERKEHESLRKRTASEQAAYNTAIARQKKLDKLRADSLDKERKSRVREDERARKEIQTQGRLKQREAEHQQKRSAKAAEKAKRDQERADARASKEAASAQRASEREEKRRSNDADREKKRKGREADREKKSSPFGTRGKASNVVAGATALAFGRIAKIIGSIAAAAIEVPLLPGQLMRGAMSLAEPASNLRLDTFSMGRAGHFGGEGLYKGLFPGTGTTAGTEWMSQLGLTPEKVIESLQNYGISPRSSQGAMAAAKDFGFFNLTPGFSGMEPFTSEKIARQGRGLGEIGRGETSISSYLNPFRHVMEDAIAKGMDRATVLDNIQGSIESIAKTGALGVSSNAVLEMFSKFASTGSAGGRSGTAAASALEGLSGFVANPSSNTSGMFMLYSQLSKFGGLKSEGDIRRFVGEDNWNAAGQAPGTRDKAVKDIMSAAKAKNPYAALQIATTMLMGANPGRVAELQSDTLSRTVPSYLQATALGNVSNMGMRGAYGFMTGSADIQTGGGRKLSKNDIGYNDDDLTYIHALQNAGVPSQLVNSFVAAGKKEGLSPLFLAAIAQQESDFGRAKGTYDPSKYAYGIMQLDKDSQAKYGGGPMSESVQNIDAGARVFNDKLARTGDVDTALGNYSGGASNYAQKVRTNYEALQMKSNVAFDVQGAQNQASQSTLKGAEYALNTLVPVANAASAGLEKVYAAAEQVATALIRMKGEMDGLPGSEGYRKALGLGAPPVNTAPNKPMSPMHQ